MGFRNFSRTKKSPSHNGQFGASGGVVSWDTSQDFGSLPPVRALPIPPPVAKLLKRCASAGDRTADDEARKEDINRPKGHKNYNMKKIIISLIAILATISLVAQTQVSADLYISPDNAVVYRLFPTQNMWTFIKLNTQNGQLWQVQYDTKGNNRGEIPISLTPLVSSEKEVNGRFFLYPTQNMYNFILLDQLDGRMWQVQWSLEAKNRGIIPME